MKKVTTFEIRDENYMEIAKSIWNNLRLGWEKDLEMMKGAGFDFIDKRYLYVKKPKIIKPTLYALTLIKERCK